MVRKGERADQSSIACRLGPGVTSGPTEDRQFAGKPFPPVAHLSIHFPDVELTPLPLRVVSELDGWLRKRRRVSLRKGLVQRCEFRWEYAIDGHAVDDALVRNQEQAV